VPKVSLSGPCAQQVKKLSIAQPGKKKKNNFVIHRVHPEHQVCVAFVELTNAHTGGTLLYIGESPGAIMNKAFEEEMGPAKRQEITAWHVLGVRAGPDFKSPNGTMLSSTQPVRV
jgi:hypothetical protein